MNYPDCIVQKNRNNYADNKPNAYNQAGKVQWTEGYKDIDIGE